MSKIEYTKPSAKLRSVRTFNIIKGILSNPVHVISIISIIFLIYAIVLPMWEIVSHTLTWHPEDVRATSEAKPGQFTFYHWLYVVKSDISSSIFYKPLMHSLEIAVTVCLFAMLLGGALAWLVTRSDIPFKKTIGVMAVIPYMIPSWIKTFAWLVVFKNDRVGGSQGLLQYAFGWNPPDWVSYGYFPISLTLIGHYFVFFYLLIAVALSSINNSLEETAEIMGARKLTTLRKITFPLVLPAIMSAFILTFSKTMGSFGVAAFLGLPVKYYTISTMLYGSMRNRMISDAYVLSLVLIAISAITIYINQRAIGKRKSYATIGGKDARRNLTSLGKWRKPIFGGVITFLFSAAVFPILLLLLQSFMLKEGDYSIANLTTHFWNGSYDPKIASGEVGVLKNSQIGQAMGNSLKVAFIGAGAASLIGLIFGYIVTKARKTLTSKVVEQLSFLPYLIPGISLSAIYLSMFAQPKFLMPALYGTLGIIILITVVKELPFATRAGTSTMFQIGGELEEAAVIQGAGWFRRFIRIIIPLSWKGVVSAFLLLFIGAMKELDLIILLITPKTGTLTTLTFEYADKGYQQYSNAIILIIIAIILTTHFLATKFAKADLSKGIGG